MAIDDRGDERETAVRAMVYGHSASGDDDQLRRQLNQAREHATRNEWVIVGERKDAGQDRSGLRAALAAARRAEYDVLVIASVDRVGRQVHHLAAIVDELRDASARLVCADGSWEDAPSARLFLDMATDVGSREVAAQESERAREREHRDREPGWWDRLWLDAEDDADERG